MSFPRDSRFQEGTRLRYAVHDDRGVLLLSAGSLLTPSLVSLFERRGIRLSLTVTLKVVRGGEVGLEIPIPDSSIVNVGRNPNCAIRPNSPLVSGHHCVFVQLPLGFFVEDMKSTNGTLVNGVRITDSTELKNGDIVSFGDMAVEVQLFAKLEGATEDVQSIVGVILADQTGDPQEPQMGKTMLASPAEAAEVSQALQKAWEEKYGKNPTR